MNLVLCLANSALLLLLIFLQLRARRPSLTSPVDGEARVEDYQRAAQRWKQEGKTWHEHLALRSQFLLAPQRVDTLERWVEHLLARVDSEGNLELRRAYLDDVAAALVLFTERAQPSQYDKALALKKRGDGVRETLRQQAASERQQVQAQILTQLSCILDKLREHTSMNGKEQDKLLYEASKLEGDLYIRDLSQHDRTKYQELKDNFGEIIRDIRVNRDKEITKSYNSFALNLIDDAFNEVQRDKSLFKPDDKCVELLRRTLARVDGSLLEPATLSYFNYVYAHIFDKAPVTLKPRVARVMHETDKEVRV